MRGKRLLSVVACSLGFYFFAGAAGADAAAVMEAGQADKVMEAGQMDNAMAAGQAGHHAGNQQSIEESFFAPYKDISVTAKEKTTYHHPFVPPLETPSMILSLNNKNSTMRGNEITTTAAIMAGIFSRPKPFSRIS